MEKKYQLTDETKTFFGRTLHRIQALKDFRDVKAGEIGGWVESEDNLSQEGLCWVYDYSKVYNEARISEQARIFGQAIISGQAQIFGKAHIGKNAYITSTNDYFVIENIGSRHDTTTFYLDKSRHVWVSTGCFNDRLEVFEKAVINTHGNNQFAKEYFKAIEFVKFKLIENNY